MLPVLLQPIPSDVDHRHRDAVHEGGTVFYIYIYLGEAVPPSLAGVANLLDRTVPTDHLEISENSVLGMGTIC